MKKLLALALALVLVCSLCVPALAAEEKDAVELLEELGILDGSYETDVDYEDYGYDSVAEYEQAHPGELENLDADALIAAWGFTDVNMTAQEAFLEFYSYYDGSVDEVVKQAYVEKREFVEYQVQNAEYYKTDYPEQWETFDADAYFAKCNDEEWGWESKEEYMASGCILTQEEFAAMMFWDYCAYHFLEWDAGDDPDFDAEPAEPTLTLVVNGVASDVAISANDWTTYADAAELRGILGVKAVAPTYEGPVPVREAAENAGWEVQWYDGGWEGLDQQVCLWNKDAFLAEVGPKVEGFQKLYDAAMDRARTAYFTETPKRTVENLTVTFKRFDTLDGDKTCDLTLRAETVREKGVLDCTITFDVSQLLGMFTESELTVMAMDSGVDLAELKTLLTGGKAEIIMDFNSGGVAYNIPLLGLMDEDLAGWQTSYTGLFDYSQENADYAETLYETMLSNAAWLGGVTARESLDASLETIGIVFGPDNVKTAGSNVTWTLETDKVNAAISKLIGEGDKTYSIFKKCDLNMTFNAEGKTDLTLAYRMDPEGQFEALVADGAIVATDTLTDAANFELTAAAHGEVGNGTQTAKLHIKNFGVFDMKLQASTTSAAKGPRQLAEIERQWVKPADGATVTVAP